MGCTHPAVSGTSTSPPFTTDGALGQLTAVAGAAEGARQTFPALPAFPHTRPVGQPLPESQDRAQNSPVDIWTHLLPAGQLLALPQLAVQRPPGKSALSTQVSPAVQLGVQLADPWSGVVVPEHAAPSAARTRRKRVAGGCTGDGA